MADPDSFAEIVRALVANPDYRRTLTQQVEARTADPQLLDRLVAYARSREVTSGHALVRKLLTEAGVSWEAR